VAPAIYADGPEGKKEVMQPAPPVCELYRAHEWDLDIWGAFMFSGNSGTNDVPRVDPFTSNFPVPGSPEIDPTITAGGVTREPQSQNPNERINIGQLSKDELMGRDDTFGGGVDLKYFWSRYFGAGIEGLGIASKTNFAGAELGTLTIRYPWGRFAPYGWGGVGALEGGATLYRFFNEKHEYIGGFVANPTNIGIGHEREFYTDDAVYNHHTRGIGQLGVGLEYRVTCHVGLMADFSWNFVFGPSDHPDRFHDIIETGQITVVPVRGPPVSTNIVNTATDLKFPGHGSDNQDFGMARFGFTFSY